MEGSSADVQVGILGPVVVRIGGRERDIGGARPRALVGAMALAGGRAVPTEELIGATWGDTPPASAEATLRVYVSRLRKILGDALTRERAGYLLRAEVDALRFSDLVDQAAGAGSEEALLLLSEGLALWRGAPLGGAARNTDMEQAAARLTRARLAAEHRRAEVLLCLGRPLQAAEALAPLVRQHPQQEQLAATLMRALYQAGRQTDALDAYRDVRTALLREFGIEPGPDLRQLHAAVLAQDPALLDARPTPPAGDRGGPAAAAAPPAAAAPATADRDGELVGVLAAGQPGQPARRAGNLPLPLTSFIGRTRELEDVLEGLAAGRSLTLVGPGGTGKTRLALEAARRWTADEGAWLVELAALDAPALVVNAVAQSLGVTIQDGRRPLDVLTGALRDRSLLLVLDNAEHVLEATAEVTGAILSSCPGVRVLATSREPLGVPGERVFPVPPLPIVERTPELITANGDAMRLFIDRARHVLPGMVLDGRTLETIRQICRELDGLPLAIELAAAELRALSPGQLREQLSDRFAVLTGGPRTALPRQRTLLMTVGWSIDLLDAEQRRLFARLSVFTGGFGLDGAEAVAGGPVAGILADLVDKSLVEVDTSRSPRRYRMLETLRAYGRTLLDDTEAEQVSLRHARWCADLVRRASAQLRGPESGVWERRLDEESGNYRTALRACLDRGDRDTALAMCAGLWWYWFRRARVDEGRRWLAEVLDGDLPATREVVQAHLGAAYLAFYAGDPVVEEHDRASVAAAEAVGDDLTRALTLCWRGYRHAVDGDLASGRRNLADGLAALPPDAPAWVRAEMELCRGQVARAAGRLDEAHEHLTAARRQSAGCGHSWLIGVSAWVAGELALDRDRPAEAAALLRQAIERARSDDDRGTMIAALRALAGTAARLGMPADGARLLGAVASLSRRSGVDMERMERPDADRTTSLLRRSLRPEAFAGAVEEGARLGPTRALELAARVCAAATDG